MTANRKTNPFLFACGVPRSGTTLLQRMLNSHPQLAVANDTHFIPRALELTSNDLVPSAMDSIEIPLTKELADNVFNYHRFYRTGIESEEFNAIQASSSTYQELVEGIFDRIAEKAAKTFAGEKTPDYVRRLHLLNGLFPKSKLLHLIRDGRNVALSLLDWATPKKGPGRIQLWESNPIAVCALWWKWLVDAGLKQAPTLDATIYCEIKYESLAENPKETIRDLCDFLGLPFDQAILEFNKGKKADKPGLSAKSAWLGPKTGLRDWRRDMQPADIELFEALAGDTLQNCGYELSTTSVSAKAKQAAEELEHWWQINFLARQTTPQNCTETNSRNSKTPGATAIIV